jgi:hypothetical protein
LEVSAPVPAALASRPSEVGAWFQLATFETSFHQLRQKPRSFRTCGASRSSAFDTIQHGGLWVTGGFIVGFDSDPETIFQDQIEFIEQAAIPWAMAGFLQAPPTTPLYERMGKEGRLLENPVATSNFNPPNFRTLLPLPCFSGGIATLWPPSLRRRATSAGA